MDNVPLSQAYLESLTTQDLIKLADVHGVDIPPDLDRIFIIEELLDLTSGDLDDDDVVIVESHSKMSESVILPKQYNITFIDLFVRDPLWVYIFWEIKGSDREVFEKAADFEGYSLKVSPWNRVAPDEIFTVPLEPEDNARYLGFPPAEGENCRNRSYKIELLALRGGNGILLADSGSFKLPSLSPRKEKQEDSENFPLIFLSGIKDLNILRNEDRKIRNKNNRESQ